MKYYVTPRVMTTYSQVDAHLLRLLHILVTVTKLSAS